MVRNKTSGTQQKTIRKYTLPNVAKEGEEKCSACTYIIVTHNRSRIHSHKHKTCTIVGMVSFVIAELAICNSIRIHKGLSSLWISCKLCLCQCVACLVVRVTVTVSYRIFCIPFEVRSWWMFFVEKYISIRHSRETFGHILSAFPTMSVALLPNTRQILLPTLQKGGGGGLYHRKSHLRGQRSFFVTGEPDMIAE